MNDNENVEPTLFKAVEAAIFEAVRKNGNAYWVDLQAARVLIGDSYSHQGLQTDNATCLPYAFEALRLAYAHLAFTAHAHMVKESLSRFWKSERDFRIWHSNQQGGHLRVCCIGGGPGSDVMGLFLFFQQQRVRVSNFQADVLELWSEWEETFKTLMNRICWESFDRPTGEITTDYWQFDFHKLWDIEYQQVSEQITRLSEANLVTMVKFVSSVAADKDLCKNKLITLLKCMREGALLFFLNNAGGGYARIANQAADYAGFHLIGQLEHEDFSLPFHEAVAVSSSKLRMAKAKSDKTWKISASLWQKGQYIGQSFSQPTRRLPQSHTSGITSQTTNPSSHQYHPSLSQSAYGNISQSRTVSETRYAQVHVRTDISNHILYQDLISQPYSTRQSRPSQQYSAPTLTPQPYSINRSVNYNLPQPQIHQPGLRQQFRYPNVGLPHQTSRPTRASSQSVITSQPSSRGISLQGNSNHEETLLGEEEEAVCCFCCLKP